MSSALKNIVRRSFGWSLLLLGCLVTVPLAAAEETREVVAQDLKLQVPADWKQQQPSNKLRLAQFEIPAAEGDEEGAELVIFPPFGGSKAQNIERWIAQFDAQGREVKLTQGESPQGDYVLVDIAGTYQKPDGPPFLRRTKPVEGYRMLAVILTAKDGGNYFLKVTGPNKTISAATDKFRATFGASADSEKPYEQ